MVLRNLQLQLHDLQEQQDALSFQMSEAEGDEFEQLEAALEEVEREIDITRAAIEEQELSDAN